MQPRVFLVGIIAAVACDAYVLPSGPAPAFRLRSSGKNAVPMLTMGTGLQRPVSRRAAVFLSLLPAFASVAQAKGDATLPFQTEITGSDGRRACSIVKSCAHVCAVCRSGGTCCSLGWRSAYQETEWPFRLHIRRLGSWKRSPVM
jgi:hypothetical protein